MISAERIQVCSGGVTFSIRPIQEQTIQDGLVRVLDKNSQGFTFFVQPENRTVVAESVEGIEKLLKNPELAITDRRLSNWVGNIERFLVPPVEVTNPKVQF